MVYLASSQLNKYLVAVCNNFDTIAQKNKQHHFGAKLNTEF
jgi:hypothetical protein